MSANKKITPFQFPFDESDDPMIDEFLLQNLQQEADEADKRLGKDPEVSRIHASEDQFGKIVEKLRAFGEWEE